MQRLQKKKKKKKKKKKAHAHHTVQCNLLPRVLLQRLITGRTSNAERRPIKASARPAALKRLLQPLQWEPNRFPFRHSIVKGGDMCVVGASKGSRHYHSSARATILQEMRLSRMHEGGGASRGAR